MIAKPDADVSTNAPKNPNDTLYDQYNHASGVASNSQNFEPAYDTYDDFLADDFVVPPGQICSSGGKRYLYAFHGGKKRIYL
jgi:hypothetical protein